jgi:uncharacterized protein (DUF342 family)
MGVNVGLSEIRSDVQTLLGHSREIRSLLVYADTIEAALGDAAIQFNTAISNLDYEMLEHGSPGIMAVGKRPWLLQVRKMEDILAKKHVAEETPGGEAAQAAVEVPVDTDGIFYVRFFSSEILLKVIPPVGNGNPVEIGEVLENIDQVDMVTIDRKAIHDYISKGTDSKYVSVGVFKHDTDADAKFTVSLSSDEMEAYIFARHGAKNGADITPERVHSACRVQGIVDDVDWSPLDEFIDNPVYDEQTVIARGTKQIDGSNAVIDYLFETDTTKLMAKETEEGRVDFKNLNIIQNVVAGQTVARKIPNDDGKNGKTLLGKLLLAKNGADTPMPVGHNVRVDGPLLVAEIDGRVFFQNGKVHVEPVYEIDSVSIRTGNIQFLGTVIVKGNVDDGFSVKASGDIKVSGTVGRSSLEADGDIAIQSGIVGQNVEVIRAGKSIVAKYIQNAIIEAGEDVLVLDGIISSDVKANKRIILNGKRAAIIGGHLCATEEINANTIGAADSGTETIVEVGFDAKKKQRLNELIALQARKIKELDQLELNIQTFENLKKSQKMLPAEKQLIYNDLLVKKNALATELKNISQESKELNTFLNNSQVDGRISASAIVYPGVKVVVRDAKSDIKTEVRAVSFSFKNGSKVL